MISFLFFISRFQDFRLMCETKTYEESKIIIKAAVSVKLHWNGNASALLQPTTFYCSMRSKYSFVVMYKYAPNQFHQKLSLITLQTSFIKSNFDQWKSNSIKSHTSLLLSIFQSLLKLKLIGVDETSSLMKHHKYKFVQIIFHPTAI